MFLISLSLVACSEPTTARERMRQDIEFINNNEGEIYVYRDNLELLSQEDNVVMFACFSEISFTHNFIMIVITNYNREYLTESFTQHLFDLLNRNENIMLAFIDFDNFEFLRFAGLEPGITMSPGANSKQAEVFTNFFGMVNRLTLSFGVIDNPNPITLEEVIVGSFAQQILDYNQSLHLRVN